MSDYTGTKNGRRSEIQRERERERFFVTFFPSPQLGGTIGDIEGMPFVEAFRQFQFRCGSANFANIHVSLVPQV